MGKNSLVQVSYDLELPAELLPVLESSRSLQEVEEGDKMVPWYFFNMKVKDEEGKWLPPNLFFHSLREDTREEIDCVLLFLHKSHRYRIYEEGDGSETLCSSLDRREGVWRDTGEIIECSSCEYSPSPEHWKDGVPPPCRLIWTFAGFDLRYGEPFAINAKATSMTPARRFLNKRFLRKFQGKDLPLFLYKTKLGLDQPTGTYAVLTFGVTEPNSPDEIRLYAEMTESLIGSSRINFEQEQPEEVETPEES